MRIAKVCFPALLSAVLLTSLSFAATSDRISGALNGGQTVPLNGYVNRLAAPQYDKGPADPGLHFGSIMLQTRLTPSQQKDLNRLVLQQQDPKSPNYHKWLTPEQWADRFGLSPHDVAEITAWLKGQGFTGIHVARGRNWFLFSGTAAQIQNTFGTEIHQYEVNGEKHVANATSPRIPAALVGIVAGVRGLDDFHMKPRAVRSNKSNYAFSDIFGNAVLAPGDIYAMYDLNALISSGIDGTGQKLVIVGQTDIYLSDINDFRSGFGLSTYTCTTAAAPPNDIITACSDPHFQYFLAGVADPGAPSPNDLTEADLDVEWSSATAPNATIVYDNAPANSSTVNTGVGVALFDAIDQNRGAVISMSYGNCEWFYPASVAGSADETEFLKANSQGQTFVNSSGDSGAASCDPNNSDTTGASANAGWSVNYPASSPEVTAVGGTSFSLANMMSATFWNTTSGAAGVSLITPAPPEQTWNDDANIGADCQAGTLNSTFCANGGGVAGWTAMPTTNSVAVDQQNAQADIGLSAGGGGASNCATQTGGNCTAGFPQPSYQAGLTVAGLPSWTAGARWVPDVAMLASANFPGYIFCTNVSELGDPGTGSTCATGIAAALALPTPPLIGGTSAAAPVFAGIVTLINQALSSTGQGNINPVLYQLAAAPSNNAFHKVNTGTNIVACAPGTPAAGGPPQCPSTGATAGFLGFDSSASDATTGYNLVTGLGSVDGYNLATAFAGAVTTYTIAASAPASVVAGSSTTSTITVTPAASFTGTVTLTCSGLPTGATCSPATVSGPSWTTTLTISTSASTPAGTSTVTITGTSLIVKKTTTVSLVVTGSSGSFTMTPDASSYTVAAGSNAISNITVTPSGGFNGTVTLTCSGLPTGASCNPATVSGPSYTAALTITTLPNMAATTGTTVTITGTSGSLTATTTVTLIVTATNQTITLKPDASSYSVTQGMSVPVNIFLTGTTLPVTYTCTEPASLTESTCTGPIGATTTSPAAFTITTTAPSLASNRQLDRGLRIFYAALLPGLLGIVFVAGSRKRSMQGMRIFGLIMILGASSMWMGSCSSNNSTQKNPGTPKGNYQVTISATTGGGNPSTATVQINLAVQ